MSVTYGGQPHVNMWLAVPVDSTLSVRVSASPDGTAGGMVTAPDGTKVPIAAKNAQPGPETIKLSQIGHYRGDVNPVFLRKATITVQIEVFDPAGSALGPAFSVPVSGDKGDIGNVHIAIVVV